MIAPALLPGALPDGDAVRSADSVVLPPRPDVIAEARRFVVDHAGELDADTCDTLRLLTSELVTNAVLHARTSVDVGVATSDRSILVTVADEARQGPSLDRSEREGGRGLVLVQALAECWAIVHHDPAGKTAWFRLPRPV